MKAKGDRNCTNCAFRQTFKYFTSDKQEMMRCWEEPGVCDHAFVQTAKAGDKYVCSEHRFPKERDEEMYRQAKFDYACLKSQVERLEKRWPVLAMMDWKSYLHKSNDNNEDEEND